MTSSADTTKETRSARLPRVFTPARLIALALIALTVLGLAYLRFGRGDDAVSVPAGAKAGDLILRSGSYATENGDYKADVGTLVVPENRADPNSRLIALPVVRIRARSAHPGAPIFRLEGGPGVTNMEFDKASRFADKHDVVLVGYRGVDGSSVLDAAEVESALRRSGDLLGVKSIRAVAAAYRSAARRMEAEGVDLAGYGLAQQVDDLEAARVALGYDRIDLLSESAGTRTAMIYSWRYPASIHRSVMIAANPPGNFLWDAETTDELIARYSALYAEDGASRDGTTGDLAASLEYTSAHLPDRWLFLPIKKGNVRIISFFGLMESTAAAGPASGPMVLDSWRAAANGDASGLWFASLAADILTPRMFVRGQYAAAARLDAQAGRDYFASVDRDDLENLGVAATAFGWDGGRLIDAWPAAPDEAEYSRVRTSDVETLLIGGELDFATPPQIATKELLPYLPNGHQVVLPGFGHSLSFWSEQPEAGTRLITAFFDNGKVDDSLYTPQRIDFTPPLGNGSIAKILLGSMSALAVLTALSLPGMALRVHRRGRYGAKAGATLRSLYAVVLGFGGWCLGALFVMTTMPDVPVDDELLVTLSMAVPVWLGVYLAWVDRGWSAAAKTMGFAAAAAGALVGGWLGYHAAGSPLAVVTTAAGAILAANLALIIVDLTHAQRSRVAAAGRLPASAPAPSASQVCIDEAP